MINSGVKTARERPEENGSPRQTPLLVLANAERPEDGWTLASPLDPSSPKARRLSEGSAAAAGPTLRSRRPR